MPPIKLLLNLAGVSLAVALILVLGTPDCGTLTGVSTVAAAGWLFIAVYNLIR